MKRKIAFVILVMAAFPVWAQQIRYSINGVSKYNGKKVFLIDRLSNRQIDSTIVTDGKFSMEGMAGKDAYLSLKQDGLDWWTIFFNDGTPMTINVNDSTLKGSAMNERLVGYDLALSRITEAFQKKYGFLSMEELEKLRPEWEPLSRKIHLDKSEMREKIFREERETLIPVAFIEDYYELYGQQKLDSVLNTKPAYANHPIVKRLVKMIAYEKAQDEKRNAFIGQQFTDLEEADVDGKMHKLSEYVGKGQWVLVDFWASWCGPCRAEMPNVVAAYEKYHAKGFDIVGLSFDNKKEPWVKAITDLNMPWTHLSDLKGWKTVASGIYSVNAIPDNLLIDPQGKIVARGLRAQALHQKLKEIFSE